MIKKKAFGTSLKEQLQAGARDRLYNFMLADKTIRGAILHGTRLVNEMRFNHELGILETLVLGHAYLAGGLMSANLKGNDRLSIQIDCSGPIKGLIVEANAFGEVRGYLKRVPIPIERPMKDFNVSPFFGAGFLAVTRSLEDAKQPFTGRVVMEFGSIAKDLANYFLTSEQIPTAFNLSVKFDREGEVTGAGGLFLQVMPGADEKTVMDLEKLVAGLPSIGEEFSGGRGPMELIGENFRDLSPEFLENHRIEFMCHCNADKIRTMLSMLSYDDLKEISENGPFPVNIRCHHCNTAYEFSEPEIHRIFRTRFAH